MCKVGMVSNDVFDLEEIMASPKEMRQSRMLDYLGRYDYILKKNLPGWIPLSFEKKKILEIGSGATMGWAPIAAFLGCESYVCCEPMFNEAIRSDVRFQNLYLKKMHRDLLCPMFGPRLSFDQFLKRIDERVRVERQAYHSMNHSGSYDVMLSNSVLEHVFPLNDTLDRMRAESASGCRYLHDVDFGNHAPTEWPFENIYDAPMASATKKHLGNINLFRVSDVHEMFLKAGFDSQFVPIVRIDPDSSVNMIHSDWTDRYDMENLNVKTAFFVGSSK